MTAGPTRSRVVTALVTGAATTVHYALPDVVPSRAARGWMKAGLSAVALAAAVPDLRSAWATARGQQGPDDELLPSEAFRSRPARSKAVALAPLAAVLACAVGGVVAAERRAFRHGQARAAAGKRLAHTGPALLYGALAGGLWLLPAPSDPQWPRSPERAPRET
jgi:hypothetical protein